MPVIFDLHTHVFNAGFIPMEGVMVAKGVPAPVAARLTTVFEHLLERTPPTEATRMSVRPSTADRASLMDMLENELIGGEPSSRLENARPVEPNDRDLIGKFVA